MHEERLMLTIFARDVGKFSACFNREEFEGTLRTSTMEGSEH
jgi:hypothetical protein